ncbi:MAG: ribosome maturation factor RimM [Acholeplasmataceae bacterium]
MVQIGKITSTHGIKGEVKIYSMSDFNRFFVGGKLYVLLNKEKIELTIKRARPQKNQWIVLFDSYDNINDVLKFKDLDIYSDDVKVDELEDDDYHYQSLIDKKVYTDQNIYVGFVSSMIKVPQGHLMEVEKTNQERIMIPFVKAFIGDISEDKIIIFPIEGLL